MNLSQIFGKASEHVPQTTLPPSGGSADRPQATADPRTVSPRLTTGRVYRSVAFDVETFDALKEWQRDLEETLGERIGNAEVLRMLILAHHAPDAPRATR
jgi:hypothetical protein